MGPGPGAEMMYGGMDGSMMGAAGMGAQARMYDAAGADKARFGGMQRGGAMPKSGSSSELCDPLGGSSTGASGAGGGGNWVQIMDPDGKVYLVNQAAGGN